jgi:hypothetical protein
MLAAMEDTLTTGLVTAGRLRAPDPSYWQDSDDLLEVRSENFPVPTPPSLVWRSFSGRGAASATLDLPPPFVPAITTKSHRAVARHLRVGPVRMALDDSRLPEHLEQRRRPTGGGDLRGRA